MLMNKRQAKKWRKKHGIVIITVPIGDPRFPNRNGRVYNKESCDKIMECLSQGKRYKIIHENTYR